ncbi:MAG: hypothetical protein ACKO26_11355 [Planctomycetota bacterium]
MSRVRDFEMGTTIPLPIQNTRTIAKRRENKVSAEPVVFCWLNLPIRFRSRISRCSATDFWAARVFSMASVTRASDETWGLAIVANASSTAWLRESIIGERSRRRLPRWPSPRLHPTPE